MRDNPCGSGLARDADGTVFPLNREQARSHRAETGYNHKNRWQNRLRICATSAIH